MLLSTARLADDIRHNCRIKKYPDGSREILVADRCIFREAGYESIGVEKKLDKLFFDAEVDAVELSQYSLARREASEAAKAAANLERAKRRARSAVSDLALSNEFRYFVTLTLAPDKINRYDAAEVTRKLNNWLDNRVRRDGLAYVLVAERHKDGAIHFHGFFNGALPVEDSGTIDLGGGKPKRPRSAAQRAAWLAQGGRIVYNLPGWSLGFTTAIELYGERRAAVGYVCKYITKASGKVGGRWYYSGGALQRPSVELCRVEFDDFLALDSARTFTLDELGARVIKFTMEGG